MTVNTELGLSYELDIDINLAGVGALPVNWQQIRFTSAIAPVHSPVMADAATYDDEGAQNQVKIGETGSVSFTVQNNRNPDGTYLPEVQALINAAKPGTRGNQAAVEVRYYDSEGADYAFQGIFSVDVARQTTGNAEIGGWTVTLTSRGPIKVIANPYAENPVKGAPAISSALPAAAVAGSQLTIKGSGFTGTTGATGVKVGAVNATSYVVAGDNVIVAVVPAGSAGSAPITVTRGSEASDPFPYSRGA